MQLTGTETAAAPLDVEFPACSSGVLQKIIDTAREAVIVVDSSMRITLCNVPAAVAFSREGLELEGKRLSEVVRDLDLHEAFARAVNAETTSDVRLELPNQQKRRFEVHVAPIEFDGLRFAVGSFYETTQIDRLEVIRQEFLSNISHELRTPLTSILAFVETIENGVADEGERGHFLAIIRRNAERMHTLISDILELSLIESGGVSIDIRHVRLDSAVSDVVNTLSAKARDRNITLSTDIPTGTLVKADPVRLEQMLTNLIDNGIKFNRADGSVNIRIDRSAGRDVISVTDTGEGILPEHQDRIFERFYRADKARSREMGGTGLGLAIVKHLARLHGGEVMLESELGIGTTFRIVLPS